MKKLINALFNPEPNKSLSGYPIVTEIKAQKPTRNHKGNPVFEKPFSDMFCPINGRGNLTVYRLGKVDYKKLIF